MPGDRATARQELERNQQAGRDRPDLKKEPRSDIPKPQESSQGSDTGGGSGKGGSDSKPASQDYREPTPNEAAGGGDGKPSAPATDNNGIPTTREANDTGAGNQKPTDDKGIPATREASDSGSAAGKPTDDKGIPTTREGSDSGAGKPTDDKGVPTTREASDSGRGPGEPTDDKGIPTTREGSDSSGAGKPTSNEGKPASNADTAKQAVKDGKGVKADVEAQQHKHAPNVREAKGVTGKEANSAHLGPTSALRDTKGYVRGEAVTATLSKDTHRALDNQWKSACRDMVAAGRKDMTVRELYNEVAKAIRNTDGLTPQQKGTMESMLHKELYGTMGLKPDDKVRLPYSGSGGKGAGEGGQPADPKATEPRTEPKGPAVNERGEVIGSKAEGATAKLEKQEAKAAGAAAKGGPHGEAPHLPKGEGGLGKAIGGAADKILHGLGKIGGIFGAALDAKQAYDEGKEYLAREKPEALKEGDKVDLTMNPNKYSPGMHVPSGYSIEKTNGEVIYRNEQGNQVSRDEAIRNSTGGREERDAEKRANATA